MQVPTNGWFEHQKRLVAQPDYPCQKSLSATAEKSVREVKVGDNVIVDCFDKTTRAGALAGVDLSLDPEGTKRLLMWLSLFALKQILKTLISVD